MLSRKPCDQSETTNISTNILYHIKSQLAKMVPSKSVAKIVALEKDSQSAEYLTMSISQK